MKQCAKRTIRSGSDNRSCSWPSHRPVNINCAGLTDIGRQRTSNQDQFLIADLHKNLQVQSSSVAFENPDLFGDTMGKLLLVADGMGGAQAGEVASAMAVRTMAQYLLNSMHWLLYPKQPEIEQFIEDLKAGAFKSHEQVRQDADSDPSHAGMGTTLTVAYLMWPMLYVLHVGDSRCYVLRDGVLQRLTKDQTLPQQLYDSGQLTDAEFNQSPYHNVLTSAIGVHSQPDAVVYRTRLLDGDRIMLCSDGINVHLDDGEIETILGADKTAEEICRTFIETTNERGGRDNITAVIAKSERISPTGLR